MASGKSTYLDNALLNQVLGATAFAAPATVYVALFTVTPGAGGGGTEVTGGGYARQAVTNNATNWPAAANGSKSNGTAITWPAATAAWGTITGVAIFDAATLGNELYWGDLAATKAIGSGDQFTLPAGSLTVSEA